MPLSTPLSTGFDLDLTVPKIATSSDKVKSQEGGLADASYRRSALGIPWWSPKSSLQTSSTCSQT